MYNLALETKQMAWAGNRVNLNCFDLIKQLPDLKKECEWLKEINSQSLQQPIRNLDNAFTRFFKGQDPSMAIEEQLLALQRQAEEGEITYSEMIRQTAPLIEERASMRIKQDLQQEEEAKQIRGAQDAFLAENPDFLEFTKSPEAQAIRQANPIMDNVSAYYAYKAESEKMEKANLQAQIDELRLQMQNTIKGAAGQQGAVAGTGGGESLPIQNLGRNDGLKPFEGGLAALKRARAAQS